MAGHHPRERAGLSKGARALLDAVIAIGSDLDLHHVLDRIVLSACELTEAKYGALGVIGGDGRLSDFIAHGIDPRTRASIGDLPRGRGILGLLIEHPESLRLSRLQDHPASYGFPERHPKMESFLGVPVRVRGVVFGNLYLTEKAGGREFTDQDEELVLALATAAGYVIENARTYAASERQRKWLEVVTRLNDSLNPSVGLEGAVRHVATGARLVAGARAVAVLQHVDGGEPDVLATDGREADQIAAYLARLPHEVALAAKGETPDPVSLDGGRTGLVLPVRMQLIGSTGSTVLVVVVDSSVHKVPGSSLDEQVLIRSYADQAALALDRVQALADREELAIVSDRERIARDLHDLVIQRLFATGLQLQGARTRAVTPELSERLDQAVLDLDTTIRDIRATIFELQQGGGTTVRASVTALVREYTPVLGFTPTVRVTGPVNTVVQEHVAEQLLAVLREALSNVARHARATKTAVEIDADSLAVRLKVSDDGIGVPQQRRESGLRNVRRRAQELNGSMRLSPAEPHGTVLEWQVLVSAPAD